MVLSVADFFLKKAYVETQARTTELMVGAQERTSIFIQLQQNVRSLINVANGLEFDKYELSGDTLP